MITFAWPNDRKTMIGLLLRQTPFNAGSWQSMDVAGSKAHETYELEDVTLLVPEVNWGPNPYITRADAAAMFAPDLPWADDHFAERVSGVPHNPPPSAAAWPHAVRGNGDHTTGPRGEFDHTYPERFWPKHAGHDRANCPHVAEAQDDNRPGFYADHWACRYGERKGVRFNYGDLTDVVDLIVRNPLTRQAYLPVWFPEDTGPAEHVRVPCTLGYHFMVRDNRMSMRYYLRSCDVVRHLNNDMYFAARLLQYVCYLVNGVYEDRVVTAIRPGKLVAHIASLHAFRADKAKLEATKNGTDGPTQP